MSAGIVHNDSDSLVPAEIDPDEFDEICAEEEEMEELHRANEVLPDEFEEDVDCVDVSIGDEDVEIEVDETEEVEVEEEETEEVEEEEEEAGVYEIERNGKRYFTTNEQDGIVYEAVGEDDVGDEIGKFVKGKLVLNKTK